MMTVIRKIWELITFLWVNVMTPMWVKAIDPLLVKAISPLLVKAISPLLVKAISPLWVKVISPLWVKAKYMKIFERPGDTIEMSRLRLELRQAFLKLTGYALMFTFIRYIVVPYISVAVNSSEDPSLFIGTINILLLPFTFGLLIILESMKLAWIRRTLEKKESP